MTCKVRRGDPVLPKKSFTFPRGEWLEKVVHMCCRIECLTTWESLVKEEKMKSRPWGGC